MDGIPSYARQKILLDVVAAAKLADRCGVAVKVPPDFHERVEAVPDRAACWPWRGPMNAQGYGQIRVGEIGRLTSVGVHRVAYYLATGFWETGNRGRVVRHLCHNPACCNPLHLLVGTRLDNAWDSYMAKAGVDLVAIRLSLGRGPWVRVVGIAR